MNYYITYDGEVITGGYPTQQAAEDWVEEAVGYWAAIGPTDTGHRSHYAVFDDDSDKRVDDYEYKEEAESC
jgi:hypothetical protein